MATIDVVVISSGRDGTFGNGDDIYSGINSIPLIYNLAEFGFHFWVGISVSVLGMIAMLSRILIRLCQGNTDALRKLDSFLDASSYRGPSVLLVIHGYGTGVLRRVVRQSLGASQHVESFRPGESHEGGDGVTWVQLYPN